METPRTFWQFVQGLFSEPDGTPSSSRVITFLATLVWLVMLSVHFFKTGQLPDWMQLLAGSSGAAAPYLANQLRQFLGGKPPVAETPKATGASGI